MLVAWLKLAFRKGSTRLVAVDGSGFAVSRPTRKTPDVPHPSTALRAGSAALDLFLQPTHTSGFACARLQCGLTCGRASGASAWVGRQINLADARRQRSRPSPAPVSPRARPRSSGWRVEREGLRNDGDGRGTKCFQENSLIWHGTGIIRRGPSTRPNSCVVRPRSG